MKYFLIILLFLFSTTLCYNQLVQISSGNADYSYNTHYLNGPIFGGNPLGMSLGEAARWDNKCVLSRPSVNGTEFNGRVYCIVKLNIGHKKGPFTILNGPDSNNSQTDYTSTQSGFVFTVDVSIYKDSDNSLFYQYVKYEILETSSNLDVYGFRTYSIGEEQNPPAYTDRLEQVIKFSTNNDANLFSNAIHLNIKEELSRHGSRIVDLDDISLYGDSGGTDLQFAPGGDCIGDHRIDFIRLKEYLEFWVSDDEDGDGVPDRGTAVLGIPFDNCPNTPNSDQANSDNDILGNACDNCPTIDNNNQSNSDGDNYGDICDNCPNLTNNNQSNNDFDSYGDPCDNCPNQYNEDQIDTDNDGIGDICDFGECPITALYPIETTISGSQFFTTTTQKYEIFFDLNEVSIGQSFFVKGLVFLDAESEHIITSNPMTISRSKQGAVGSVAAFTIRFSNGVSCQYLIPQPATITPPSFQCPSINKTFCSSNSTHFIDLTDLTILGNSNCTSLQNMIVTTYLSSNGQLLSSSSQLTSNPKGITIESQLPVGDYLVKITGHTAFCNSYDYCTINLTIEECAPPKFSCIPSLSVLTIQNQNTEIGLLDIVNDYSQISLGTTKFGFNIDSTQKSVFYNCGSSLPTMITVYAIDTITSLTSTCTTLLEHLNCCEYYENYNILSDIVAGTVTFKALDTLDLTGSVLNGSTLNMEAKECVFLENGSEIKNSSQLEVLIKGCPNDISNDK